MGLGLSHRTPNILDLKDVERLLAAHRSIGESDRVSATIRLGYRKTLDVGEFTGQQGLTKLLKALGTQIL
jgi:hypothetical protein